MTNVGASSRQNQINIDDTQRNVVVPIMRRFTIIPSRNRGMIQATNKWFNDLIIKKKKRRR